MKNVKFRGKTNSAVNSADQILRKNRNSADLLEIPRFCSKFRGPRKLWALQIIVVSIIIIRLKACKLFDSCNSLGGNT